MMNRRDFLTTSSGLVVGLASPSTLLEAAEATGKPIYSGWLNNKQATINFKNSVQKPYFSQNANRLAGTGIGKRALLWKFFEKVTNKRLIPHDQTIRDCVAQTYALGIDILDSIQIAHGFGSWIAKCATEPIYAGGRVEIGKGEATGGGMHGTWGGQWCRDYGILLRRPYLEGKYDFTQYSGAKARKWGHLCDRCTDWGGGVPDELEPIAKKHPVQTVTLITSWAEARDAIYNGYPVIVCSKQGFQRKRGRGGFAKPWGVWWHSMLLAGMDDTGRRPGGLFINSWGPSWITGPTRFNQPLGSFWADADVIDQMLQYEDSFAISNYIGYPKQNLNYKMY